MCRSRENLSPVLFSAFSTFFKCREVFTVSWLWILHTTQAHFWLFLNNATLGEMQLLTWKMGSRAASLPVRVNTGRGLSPLNCMSPVLQTACFTDIDYFPLHRWFGMSHRKKMHFYFLSKIISLLNIINVFFYFSLIYILMLANCYVLSTRFSVCFN